jgi:hypothetical protein
LKKQQVCLAVWDKEWDGVKLVGTAEYFTSGKWKTFVERMPKIKVYQLKGQS